MRFIIFVLIVVLANTYYLFGQEIEEVTIGSQTWMAKNLDVVTYRNGDTIPRVTDPKALYTRTYGAWMYYNNDPANGEIYGKIYNGYAVLDPRGLAPEGWHIPLNKEWKTLEIYLGMSQEEADKTGYHRGTNEGSKLAGGSNLWIDGDLKNNNEFGKSSFNGLPGGYQLYKSRNLGETAMWWSSSLKLSSDSVLSIRHLEATDSSIVSDAIFLFAGCYVRCIKGPPLSVNCNNPGDINIKIYPNPAQDEIHILKYEGRIAIFNSLGIEVWNGYVQEGASIDISGFAEGCYIVRMKDRIAKFIKW